MIRSKSIKFIQSLVFFQISVGQSRAWRLIKNKDSRWFLVKYITLPFARLYNGQRHYLFSTKTSAFCVAMVGDRWAWGLDHCCLINVLLTVMDIDEALRALLLYALSSSFIPSRDEQKACREACMSEGEPTITTCWVYLMVKPWYANVLQNSASLKKPGKRNFSVTFLLIFVCLD